MSIGIHAFTNAHLWFFLGAAPLDGMQHVINLPDIGFTQVHPGLALTARCGFNLYNFFTVRRERSIYEHMTSIF